MMNNQEIDPITELKQRGGGLRAMPVRFDIDGLHVDIGEGEPAALANELAGRDAALVGAGGEAPDMNATRAFLARRDVALSETDFGLAALRSINGSGAVFFSEKSPF